MTSPLATPAHLIAVSRQTVKVPSHGCPPRRFDLASARQAAEHDETALWVGDFLASRGSDNAVLAAALAQREHWWLGPISLPLDALTAPRRP